MKDTKMKNVRHFLILTILTIALLASGCEASTSAPLVTTTPTAGQVAEEASPESITPELLTPSEAVTLPEETEIIITPTPTLTPIPATNTPPVVTQPSVSPTIETSDVSDSPTPTPPSPPSKFQSGTTPDTPTTETTPEFQIAEARVETDASRETQLSLAVTLNKSEIYPPVQELIYITTNPLNGSISESISTIWRTSLQNIGQAQPIIKLTHRREAFPDGLALSPNGKFLVYGQEYNKRTHLMEVWLLDLDNGTTQVIDKDALPQVNSRAFLWSMDGESIIYTKASEAWTSSEVTQHVLETDQTYSLFAENALINLVGWNDQGIYYIPVDFTSPQTLKLFDANTGQTQEILTLQGMQSSYIRTSPNHKLVLFDNLVVDLQTKTQISAIPFYRPLWFPDSQSLLRSDTPPMQTLTPFNNFSQQSNSSLTSEINLPVDKSEMVNWSPDGRYLIYRNLQTDLYYLLDITFGQTQIFESTSTLSVGGWVSQ